MFPYPANYQKDVYGNAPPPFGGTLAVLAQAFAFDGPDAEVLFALPAGAQIVGFGLDVQTTFDGSATLSVGDDSSPTFFLSAASVLGTAGPVYSTAWLTNGKWFTIFPSGKNINVTVGGSPTQGVGVLSCYYIMKSG